ncbi:MAG: hypothetical protein IJS28_07230 [Synergistaceae bacterium]|nr:hypothetical protein [Synergistaceae bacterium]
MPDEAEKLSGYVKLLQEMQEIQQLLGLTTEWKCLFLTLFISITALLVCEIPSIRIILDNMYTTIRTAAACGLIVGIVGVAYRIAAALYQTIEHYFSAKKEQCEQAEREEKERREQAEREEAERKSFAERLSHLTDTELSVLKYMVQKGGISWLPISEGTTLNLYGTGFICPVFNVTMLRGELLGEHKQCLACKVSEECEKNIHWLYGDMLRRWQSVSPADWLDIYANAIEA